MTILSLFPQDLKLFLLDIEKVGAQLCLVGGAPRDFLMDGKLSNDLDFEVRKLNIGEIKKFLKSKAVSFDELPYDIIRVDYKGFDLEFSSPRLEKHLPGNKSHHHFEATLESSLSYKDAFIRRDFSINAIGIEFSIKDELEKMIDPYQGIRDLKEAVLKEISKDFFLDSVRFLRLVRFHVKFGFNISESIKSQMGLFDLSELSLHHFKEELKKSEKAGEFINVFCRLINEFQLPVNEKYHFFSNIHFSKDVETIEDMLAYVFLNKIEDAEKVSNFFSLPKSTLQGLKSFASSYQNILALSASDLKKLAAMPMDQEQNLKVLRDLKNLEEKKEWRVYFPNHLLISWEDWENVHVSAREIEQVPAQLRSYLKYYKTLQAVSA